MSTPFFTNGYPTPLGLILLGVAIGMFIEAWIHPESKLLLWQMMLTCGGK
jgi:hypothetical protein